MTMTWPWRNKNPTGITEIQEEVDPTAPKNVIVFGTTGVGKSSVINMLPNDPDFETAEARVGNDIAGVTSESKAFRKLISGQRFNVYDTCGMGEDTNGTVPPEVAIQAFHDLIISQSEINLILLVVRAGRLGQMEKNNAELIKLLCGKEAPVALVVTGVENEDEPHKWWENQLNGGKENKYWSKVKLQGYACVVASRGRKDSLADLYDASKPRLEDLLLSKTANRGRGCVIKKKPWIDRLVSDVHQLTDSSSKAFAKELYDLLLFYGIKKSIARSLIKKIHPKRWIVVFLPPPPPA